MTVPQQQGLGPLGLDEATFMARFGGAYEESPWVARILWWQDGSAAITDAAALAAAMAAVVDRAPEEHRLALLRAHPDLAGRAAVAGDLTAASRREQAGAGLDQCSTEEFARFQRLNAAYRSRFRFPFIIAVAGLDRHAILAAFETRLDNSPAEEHLTAIAQVHRIAALRIHSSLKASLEAGQ